jgi:UTP--glucose-1-phosphate uridylyltransferase
MHAITKAVIPVAGFGTRFLPATKAQPKEMLPIVDKPTIQYIVEEAVAAGIKQIIFITGTNKRAIEDHFDRNFELEYRLEQAGKKRELEEIKKIAHLANFIYIRQRTPSGLGHAILQAEPAINDEPFAVLLGDDLIFSKQPAIGQLMGAFSRCHGSVVGVTTVPKKNLQRYGIVAGRPAGPRTIRVEKIVEKPTPAKAPSRLGVTGRYVFTPEIFNALRHTKPGVGNEIQITDAIAGLAARQPLFAYRYEGDYYDCGDKERFLEAQIHAALERPDLSRKLRAYLRAVV